MEELRGQAQEVLRSLSAHEIRLVLAYAMSLKEREAPPDALGLESLLEEKA